MSTSAEGLDVPNLSHHFSGVYAPREVGAVDLLVTTVAEGLPHLTAEPPVTFKSHHADHTVGGCWCNGVLEVLPHYSAVVGSRQGLPR